MKGCPVLLPTLGEPCLREISAEHGFGLCEEHSLRMLGRWRGDSDGVDALRLRIQLPKRTSVAHRPGSRPHPGGEPRPCRCGCGRLVGPKSQTGLAHKCYSREYMRRRCGMKNLLDQPGQAGSVA